LTPVTRSTRAKADCLVQVWLRVGRSRHQGITAASLGSSGATSPPPKPEWVKTTANLGEGFRNGDVPIRRWYPGAIRWHVQRMGSWHGDARVRKATYHKLHFARGSFRRSGNRCPSVARLTPLSCRGRAGRHGAQSKTPATLAVTRDLGRRSQPSRLPGGRTVTWTDASFGAEGFATRFAARRTTRDRVRARVTGDSRRDRADRIVHFVPGDGPWEMAAGRRMQPADPC